MVNCVNCSNQDFTKRYSSCAFYRTLHSYTLVTIAHFMYYCIPCLNHYDLSKTQQWCTKRENMSALQKMHQ